MRVTSVALLIGLMTFAGNNMLGSAPVDELNNNCVETNTCP